MSGEAVKRQIRGQIDIATFMEDSKVIVQHCGHCICRSCLLWNTGRCPYGTCYDDFRAKENPYDKAHPDKPPRKLWSNWNKPGEQAYWCRGGTFYPVKRCEKFVKYFGCEITECIKAPVAVYQDGYISCSLVDSVGYEACYREFEEKQLEF